MNKISHIIIFVTTLFVSIGAQAQSAIVPVGGDSQSSSGSVSYTVGQIAVTTTIGGNGTFIVTEGVQQPYEILTVGVDDYPQIILNAKVFPNPTDNLAQLQLNGFEIPAGGLKAHLYDENGKLLQTISVDSDLTTFNIGQYATGHYYLSLFSSNRSLKTFKIIRR